MKNILIIIAYFVFQLGLTAQNIHRTACNGNLVRLDSMLTNNVIDVKDNRGRSLLHWAVACKKKDIFDFLIKKGININGIDNQGKTPMHVAVQFDNKEYLDYLIKVQPNTDWQSRFGASLLEVAVLNKNKSLIEKLITNGIDINITNKRGSTALEISQRIGALDVSEHIISLGADKNLVRVFKMEGKYMGQEEPGINPKMFAPNFISTEEQEFGSVFNKERTEFYFGVDVGGRNEIRFSKMEENQWTKPVTILSDKRYNYNDPFLSNKENRLYFISKRALDGKGEIKDVDIWYVERIDNGWSEPINAGSNINTSGDEYYISFTNDGTMYFASDGHTRKDTTRTDHDIYYAKMIDNEFQEPVLLDSAVNTTDYEADVFVSPDESYIIFCSTREGGFGRGDLYISFKNDDGNWTKAVNMGKEINTKHYEYCPFVTKDGKYLLYTSNQDIYWVSTEVILKIKNKDN
ncbi:ankyrin repeat domain-containing protein [Galbibacter sp. EGI 63066]|uniref:ankyrin repeat domain-containing protein n=1 Tax=Galbibacter sp. EGI 63066 TaxID=2993559 RepID=UPI002249012B|nr:ankyrin repeat domain-containing protein [Galbibacter sp. EGI 63066]MCX2681409.1 ankyrin repeat domain-containing protein [Galbibacter sp. EGI 63066]